MHSTYTQKNIGKLLKKSIKREIVDELPLQMAENCIYTKEDIINTVVFSVSNNNFIEYGSRRLRNNGLPYPSGDNVFYHLNKLNEGNVFSMFQRVNSEMLKQAKGYGIFDRSVWSGLDIHKMPWFGEKKDKNVLGMERIRGTSFGHGYASIECVNTRKPFTLAAVPLNQFTIKKEIITKLVNESRKHVEIGRMFLDRGFFNVESIATLMELSVHFIIPAVKNKRIKRIIREAHCNSQKIPNSEYCGLITDYTMKSGKRSVTFKLVVILKPPDKDGEKWNEFAYATNINVTLKNALELADSYRNRWGIETGYRVKENVRGKTCSRNYAIRLLLQLLSIILYNLWQLCNLIVSIKINWKKRRYPIILDEFKDIISDSIFVR